MYKITEKVALNPTVTKMVIEAPLIAKKAKPGQFIIVRPFEDSERIPLTVAGYDREKGTVDIIFQIVGGTTMELNSLNAGDCVHDFVGPLGRATETEGLKKVCVVGGGVGCAIALPIAKELHDQGCVVHSVIGFRNKDLLILEDEFNAYLFRQSSDCLHVKHLVLQRVRVDKIGAHADAHHAGTVAGQHVFEHLDVRIVFGQVSFQYLNIPKACICDFFQHRFVVAKGQIPDVLNACNAASFSYQRAERVCHITEFHVCSFLIFINLRKLVLLPL